MPQIAYYLTLNDLVKSGCQGVTVVNEEVGDLHECDVVGAANIPILDFQCEALASPSVILPIIGQDPELMIKLHADRGCEDQLTRALMRFRTQCLGATESAQTLADQTIIMIWLSPRIYAQCDTFHIIDDLQLTLLCDIGIQSLELSSIEDIVSR